MTEWFILAASIIVFIIAILICLGFTNALEASFKEDD